MIKEKEYKHFLNKIRFSFEKIPKWFEEKKQY